MMKHYIVLLCIFINYKYTYCVYYGDARIANVKTCSGSNYTLTADWAVKNLTDGQAIKLTLYMTEQFGNDNKYSCKAFSRRNGQVRQIIEIKGKGACKALNTYGKKIWWEVQAYLGNEKPGYCPVVAKTWYMDWYNVKYSEISLVALVPNGRYFVDCKLLDESGKLIKACVSFDADKTG